MASPQAHEHSSHTSHDKEKEATQVHLPSLALNVYRPDIDTSAVNHRKLMRKIDYRLIPWLAQLYLLTFLDRSSIGNARLYKMEKSLHITDAQYLLAITCFFLPYGLFEVPSNLALKYFRPTRWLSFITFTWGLTTMLHGFARNFGDLVALRTLLGLTEAGLYPGIMYYLSCWYKRSEFGSRIAVLIVAVTLAGMGGGFLAAIIHNMDGVGGRPGWAWIFILEGSFTILVAGLSLWVIQDFPESATFLTETERVYVIRKLQDDLRFSTEEKFELKYVWQCLTDWKTYLGMGITMGVGGPVFAFSLFAPTIINELGFKATAANLMTVPVFLWACMVAYAVGVFGDRFGHRGHINLGLFGLGMAGYIILIVSRNAALSYFALFVAAAALYSLPANLIAMIAGNVEGSYKRGTAIAMALMLANLNGAVSSNVYRAVDSPWYSLGHGIMLAYLAIGWFSSLAYIIFLKRENKARDRGERDEVIDGLENKHANMRNGRYRCVDDARREKGDLWSGFRYTV